MAIEFFSPQHLLLFLTMSSLPVRASLPESSISRSTLLDALKPVQHRDYIGGLPNAFKSQHTSLDADATLGILDNSQEAEPSLLQELTPDTDKRTEEMEKVLDKIFDSLLTVERGREMMEKLPRPQQASGADRHHHQPTTSSQGPTSHFVRIGRSGAKSYQGSARLTPATDPEDFPNAESAVSVTSDFSLSRDAGLRSKRSPFVTKRRDRFLRFGRQYSPRSRVMRFGRRSAAPAVNGLSPSMPEGGKFSDIFNPLCHGLTLKGFLRIGRRSSSDSPEEAEEEEEEKARAQYMNHVSALGEGYFVRIGRLPSSAFLQRDPNGPTLINGLLTARRSPGYRLTRAGFVRLGKRPSC